MNLNNKIVPNNAGNSKSLTMVNKNNS